MFCLSAFRVIFHICSLSESPRPEVLDARYFRNFSDFLRAWNSGKSKSASIFRPSSGKKACAILIERRDLKLEYLQSYNYTIFPTGSFRYRNEAFSEIFKAFSKFVTVIKKK